MGINIESANKGRRDLSETSKRVLLMSINIQKGIYLPSCPPINSGFARGDEATQGASGHCVASPPRAKPELMVLGKLPQDAPKRAFRGRIAC